MQGGSSHNFANNYQAKSNLFPVPTFFDYPETKKMLWRERSVQRILNLHQQADILLYTIGTSQGRMMSAAYMGNYLTDNDYLEMQQESVVGDIANIMIREDGSYNIPFKCTRMWSRA